MTEKQLQVEKQAKAEKHLQAIEAAIKTMRKTECWGIKSSALNFEWPSAQDLLQMLKNTPIIKAADLKYKINQYNVSYFGGFQLILSNGKSSPVFLCNNGQDATNLQSFVIADY